MVKTIPLNETDPNAGEAVRIGMTNQQWTPYVLVENGEQYEIYVNISISVGSNTQLLESAFNEIEEDIHNVDVLYNILNTRLEDGILNEKGDFTLMGSITLENAVYAYKV